ASRRRQAGADARLDPPAGAAGGGPRGEAEEEPAGHLRAVAAALGLDAAAGDARRARGAVRAAGVGAAGLQHAGGAQPGLVGAVPVLAGRLAAGGDGAVGLRRGGGAGTSAAGRGAAADDAGVLRAAAGVGRR